MLKPTLHDLLTAHQRQSSRPNPNSKAPPSASATSATDGASIRSRISIASRRVELGLSPAPSVANTPTRPRRHDDPAATLRDPFAGSPPAPPGNDQKPARDRTHKHKANPAGRRQGFDFRWPLGDRPAEHPPLQRRESVSSTTSRASIVIPLLIPFKRSGDDIKEKLAQREREREAAAEKDRLKGLKEKEKLKKQLDKEARKREKEAMQEGLGVEGKRHGMMGRGAKLLRRLSIGSTQAPAWESTKGKSEAGDVQEVMKDDDESTYQLPLPRPVSPLDTKGVTGVSPLKVKVKVGVAPAWKNMIGRPMPAPTAAAAADSKKGYKHYIQAGPDAVLPPHQSPRAPVRPPRYDANFPKDLFGDLDFITGSPLPPRPPKSPSRRRTRVTAESLVRAALPEHTPQGLPSRYRPNGVTIFDIYPDEDLDYHPEPPVLAKSKTPITPAAGIQMLAPTRRAGGARTRANNRASRVFAVPEALVALWEYGLDDPEIAEMSLDEAELARRHIAPLFVHYRSTGKLPPRAMAGRISHETCTAWTASRLSREQERHKQEELNVFTVAVSPPSTESVSSKESVSRASVTGSVGTAYRVPLKYEMPHAHRRYSAASGSTGLFPTNGRAEPDTESVVSGAADVADGDDGDDEFSQRFEREMELADAKECAA
ncbi:hypothetical protein IAT38_004965 [Cryptococcus sp. DSM 104549]